MKDKNITKKADYDFINESINFKLKCIFIAIPKTGSTSVRRQIRQKGIPWISSPHLNILQARELIYPHLLRSSLKKISHFPAKTSLPTKTLEQNHSKSLKTFSNFQQSVIHWQGQFHCTSGMKPSRSEKKWRLIISAKIISSRVTRVGTQHCIKTRSTGCSTKTEQSRWTKSTKSKNSILLSTKSQEERMGG